MQPNSPPGATMRFWLANTLRELRVAADVKPETVAAIAGISAGQLWRFEAHENWPRNFDRAVWAYSVALGSDDVRDLWKLTVDRWHRYGTIPTEQAAATPKRFADILKDQAKRDRAGAPSSPGEKPNATQTRKAAG